MRLKRIAWIKKLIPRDSFQSSQNKFVYILVGILVVAAFALGSLYQKVKLLEGTTSAKPVAQAPGQPNQPNQPQAPAAKAELKVSDDDPALGPKNAKVTIVTFEDFQCPFCGAFAGLNPEMVKSMQSRDPNWQPALTNIKKEYVESGKVRFVWKDYPFLGQESFYAAQAGRCAGDQGKFWEYHDYLFSHQSGENQGAFSKENLKKFAAELKLKTADFNNCLDSAKYEKKIQEAVTYGQSVGVNGTPATFVNGKLVSGAVPFSTFKPMIEEELKK